MDIRTAKAGVASLKPVTVVDLLALAVEKKVRCQDCFENIFVLTLFFFFVVGRQSGVATRGRWQMETMDVDRVQRVDQCVC
jgi:hypothetical protein